LSEEETDDEHEENEAIHITEYDGRIYKKVEGESGSNSNKLGVK
jgi:hypothetical protein